MTDPEKNDVELLSPPTYQECWGLLPKYVQVPPDEERIYKRKRKLDDILKYGLIFIVVAVFGLWLMWLTVRTGWLHAICLL